MSQISDIDQMIKLLQNARREIKKQQKLSEKCHESWENSTPRRVQKLNADLNWQGMEVDKRLTDIARFYAKSSIVTGTEEKEYNPSGFHRYKY